MSIGQTLFGFEGRLNRARWWGFSLLALLGLTIVLTVMSVLATLLAPTPAGLVLFIFIGYLPFLWIFASLGVKRLHDRNKSVALLLVYFGVPFLFGLLVLYLSTGLAGLAAALNPSAAPTPSTVAAFGSRTLAILLLELVSFVIGAWSLIDLGFLDGTPGRNRYGRDPASPSYTVHG